MNISTMLSGSETMKSTSLFHIVQSARLDSDEKSIRLNDFHGRVADELEGEHYETFVVRNKNGTQTVGYHLTLDQCMVVSMRESKSVRRKVLAKLKEQQVQMELLRAALVERQSARLEAPELTAALKNARELDGKDTQGHHYSNEYNMINKLVLGMTAKQYISEHGFAPSTAIRDTMRPVEIQAIAELQRANTSLIDMGIDYQERKVMLQALYERKFKQLLIDEVMRIEA